MAEIEEADGESAELSLLSSGDMLRQAREQADLSVEDIAKKTRIPQRHLISVETGDFDALPGRTYAIGFAKSYARAVGVSETDIASRLREEMEEQGHGAYQPESAGYTPTNSTSIPPKMLAWTAGGIGILLLVGYLIWRTLILTPNDFPTEAGALESYDEPATEDGNDATPKNAGPAPSQSGIVILTATENVWLKIYDENDERLFEKEMKAGEKYTVPADAKGPQILTGRPDALTVTIDGQVVPALGTAERTIKDVGISATALVARNQAATTNENNTSNTNTQGQ